MAPQQVDKDLEQTFYAAEQSGLKLAIKGRLVALMLVWLWMVVSRDIERAVDITAAALVLAILGIIHFRLIGSAWDRRWVKYVFLSIDIVLLSLAIALLPPEPRYALPQIFMFRFDVFHFYYLLPAVAAFSFSPGLVAWSGILGAAGWLSAFGWVRASMPSPLEWADALEDGTQDRFISVVLSPDFAGSGSRFQEAVVFLLAALLIAVVTSRARQTIRRQIVAERDKLAVSQIFGRFVPEAVAKSMIEDGGALNPIERQATVLFVDIAGFTKLTESQGPRETVNMLNAYFDSATQIITRHDGIVTQFQGDAILAVFNVPTENEAHATCAMTAAAELLANVRDSRFAGTRLGIRIGINSGPVMAGNVGGGGRQSYTVHGDAVNMAARLEALNKTYGTAILVSEMTAALLPDVRLEKVDDTEIKGLSRPVGVFTLPDDGRKTG